MRPSREEANTRAEATSPVVVSFPVPNSDYGLVAALRASHPDAVSALCERHSGEMLQIARRILGPDPRAESLVVETLRCALRSLDDLSDPRGLRVWLISSLIAALRKRLRARNRWRWFRRGVASNRAEQGLCSEQLRATYRVLDAMPVEDRIAFCLVVIHSMEWSDAAALLGVSTAAVQSRLERAHVRFFKHPDGERVGPRLRQFYYLSLGEEIVREQECLYGGTIISELDLLVRRTRTGRRSIAWALAVAPLVLVVGSAGGALVAHFQELGFVIQGNDAACRHFDEHGCWVATPPRQPTVVSFSDGSDIRLVPGSRMRLIRTTHRGAVGTLESGSARLSITGPEGTGYRLAVGPFVLSFSKGQAEVSWDPESERIDVAVHQGLLIIAGCQFKTGRSLTAGKELGAHCVLQ